MLKVGHMLVQEAAFEEIMMGNMAIVRAMVESQTKVVTSYPGSPTPEIASAIRMIPAEQNPFYFEFSTNEKVATEVALGASLNGHLSAVFFKSVGLNVAADAFVQLGLFNLVGGLVVILGDDPGANSSQNEQDNRHYAHLSYIPCFEPATPQEVYEMYKAAAELSRQEQMPVILRLSTHVCHAKAKVQFGAYQAPCYDWQPCFNKASGPYIPITIEALKLKRVALTKLEKIKSYSETTPFNRITDHGNGDRGVISLGLTSLSLADNLQYFQKSPDLLHLGMVYPLPRQKIAAFLRTHREVKILEELDNLTELQIKAIAYEEKIDCKIIGKQEVEEWIGEYTPEKVEGLLKQTWPAEFTPPTRQNLGDLIPAIPARPPQLCPGCGHRTAFHAIKAALAKEDISVGDIGCHTLGFLPPYEMGEVVVCMGASPAVSAGLSIRNQQRKVVAFIGDSTFFHAGIPAIINAVFNRHSFTLIVLENGTTAMTGHQDHPGVGRNFREVTEKISIPEILAALKVPVRTVDAYQEAKLVQLVKESLKEEGFNVVIAHHPCMLKLTNEQRRKGAFNPKQVSVDQDVCDLRSACVREFACPSFQIKVDEQGDPRVEVHKDLCIGDGSCIQNCPSQAVVRAKK